MKALYFYSKWQHSYTSCDVIIFTVWIDIEHPLNVSVLVFEPIRLPELVKVCVSAASLMKGRL